MRFGRHIQSPYRDPARALELWQRVEDSLAAVRVVPTGDLVARLVVDDVTVCRRSFSDKNRATIKAYLLTAVDVIAQFGNSAINSQPTFSDPGLYLAPRPMACSSKYFLDSVSQPAMAILKPRVLRPFYPGLHRLLQHLIPLLRLPPPSLLRLRDREQAIRQAMNKLRASPPARHRQCRPALQLQADSAVP